MKPAYQRQAGHKRAPRAVGAALAAARPYQPRRIVEKDVPPIKTLRHDRAPRRRGGPARPPLPTTPHRRDGRLPSMRPGAHDIIPCALDSEHTIMATGGGRAQGPPLRHEARLEGYLIRQGPWREGGGGFGVERRDRLPVERVRVGVRVGDRGQADAAAFGERAHHVEDDARLARLVEVQAVAHAMSKRSSGVRPR